MGLAILPSRLKDELNLLKEYILENKNIRENETIAKHAAWVDEIRAKYDDINLGNIESILKNEVGLVFEEVLKDAGVYKCTTEGRAAFMRFIDYINE